MEITFTPDADEETMAAVLALLKGWVVKLRTKQGDGPYECTLGAVATTQQGEVLDVDDVTDDNGNEIDAELGFPLADIAEITIL